MRPKRDEQAEQVAAYCNNHMDAEQRAAFERCLQDDAGLRAELKEFEQFQALYRQLDPVEPTPSEAVFRQVEKNLARVRPKAEQKRPGRAGEPSKFVLFWQQLREWYSVPWTLAAAQAVVIAILLLPAPPQDNYTTLSDSKAVAPTMTAGINVVFQPQALESDIRQLLHSIDGAIIAGPSREGLYMLSIGREEELEAAVTILRESGLVVFAERAY